MVNYCRKCHAETPLDELCPFCGSKLSRTNEQVSFRVAHVPVRDWFVWNEWLRIVLITLTLVLVASVCAEGVAGGCQAVVSLLDRGLLRSLLSVLAVAVALIFLLLLLQGPEMVHCVLDKAGVHVRVYLADARPFRRYARLLFRADEIPDPARPKPEGLTLIRLTSLPWSEIRRVRIWSRGFALVFYRPKYWQALAVCCPSGIIAEAEGYIRKKLKKNPKAKTLSDRADSAERGVSAQSN